MNVLTFIAVTVIKIVVTVGVLLTIVAYSVWLERKVVGHMQNRWGPTRVGPFGLLQPLADGIKFILKEDLTPPYVNRTLFILAPMLSLVMALSFDCPDADWAEHYHRRRDHSNSDYRG